jgi:uncharacterized membrane protein YsdA (DUF1294 family)
MLVAGIVFGTYFIHEWRPLPWTLAYLFAANIVALIAFIWDKLVAPLDALEAFSWIHLRIPNKTLFWVLGAMWGSAGALFGIIIANHKVSEKYVAHREGLITLFLVQTVAGIWLFFFNGSAREELDTAIALVVTMVVNFIVAILAVAFAS